jgi:hypothetical protein
LLGASETVRESTGYEFEPGEQNVLAKITLVCLSDRGVARTSTRRARALLAVLRPPSHPHRS